MKLASQVRKRLTGKRISAADGRRLVETFGASWQWLFELMQVEPLAGVSFFMDEDVDPSGMGVEMTWMTPDHMIEEGTKLYPGIAAHPRGFLPVGMCLLGSGDPYFLKMSPDGSCAVVRIPHESVTVDDSIREEEVERVVDRLEDFFSLATIE